MPQRIAEQRKIPDFLILLKVDGSELDWLTTTVPYISFKRDTVNLDIFGLKDEALEESANLPAPEIIAADLEAALEQFATIAEDLKK